MSSVIDRQGFYLIDQNNRPYPILSISQQLPSLENKLEETFSEIERFQRVCSVDKKMTYVNRMRKLKTS